MKKFHLRQIQYHVAYKKRGDTEYKVIENNSNSWVADPFIFKHKNNIYIFGEYFITEKEKGAIAYSKWNGKSFEKWKIVIEEDYHLSFPNIFEEGDEIYICPESNQSNELYLYKAIEFPDKWEKVHIICNNIKCVDTVFLKRGNKKFCFTYDLNEKNENCNG